MPQDILPLIGQLDVPFDPINESTAIKGFDMLLRDNWLQNSALGEVSQGLDQDFAQVGFATHADMIAKRDALSQFNTPPWLAEKIVERYFGNLTRNDLVIEPSCGRGAFLKAIPGHVPAIGVEIDPETASIAMLDTGRHIITGDFSSVDLPGQPTAIIGNPPFKTALIDAFLQRAHGLLPEGGNVGFLLPAYAMQTAGRVAEYSKQWSIQVDMIPRNVFHGLKHPLIFSLFTKDRRRVMVGLAFYLEANDVLEMARPYREALESQSGSIWRTVCKVALKALGGKAKLQDIYREMEKNRPTDTHFWREKIRQELNRHSDLFQRCDKATYQLVC